MQELFSSWIFRRKFRRLPVELYCLIFEFAASDHQTALSLCQVSKAVRLCINPIVYHTVILSSPQRLDLFERTITTTRYTDCNLALYVRNLFLRSMSIPSGRLAANILALCVNVHRLVIDALYRQAAMDNADWPAPWEVVYIYGATSWLQKGHPNLQNTTHFHLDGVIFSSIIDSCLALPHLSHLGITHVHVASNNHVYDENFVRLISRALSSPSLLKMVLVQLQPIHTIGALGGRSGARIWKDLARIPDKRLFARTVIEPDDFYRALVAGTTIWDDVTVRFGAWRAYPFSVEAEVYGL